MKEKKILFMQKIFSCTVYMFNLLLFFFPWINVGDKRYNLLQLAVVMKRIGLDAIVSDAELYVENMATLNIGIWMECALFFMFGVFCVMHIINVLKNKESLWNLPAAFTSIILCIWNTSRSTIPALNDYSGFMWCFPLVFLVLCGTEFIAGKVMPQWGEMNREAKQIQEKEKARKKEEKERLAFEGRYNSLFYQFMWKNMKKTWRDYVLLVFCSSLVFFFLLVGFGMRTLLKEENNMDGVVQAIGSLTAILMNAMFPLAIVSIIIIVILSFYYLRCRAKNYGIFLTLGMRKRTLQFFVALEFVSVLVFTVVIGGIFGTLVLSLFISKSDLFLGARLTIGLGILPYVQAVLALLLFYLVAFMAGRDIFVSFNLGSSADLQSIREKMPFRGRKVFLGAGILLVLYSMFEYRQLRNFEKATLLAMFFVGLYLALRYGIAEYLLRERRKKSYLCKLMIHNQLFHKSKTNTAYIAAMAILLFCALFYFPFQFISVLIAEDEDDLYPYDVVCMANEEDWDIFGKLQKEYGASIDTYPMVRVANLDSTEKTEGVMEPAPPQGQQIGISESTYQELKKRTDNTWKGKSLHLDREGESVYIVHQQDKSAKAQPVDYWLSRKRPALHIGVPVDGGVNPYSADREGAGYNYKEISGEEIGSLIGTFGQGKWDNLIVFSDEYFKEAQEMWKVTDPFSGDLITGENEYTEEELVQGPSELVLIRTDKSDISEIEGVLEEFRARHEGDERYNKAVQSCYIKENAVQKLRTERIMKSVMNALMFLMFVLIYFILLAVKMLMERQQVLKRAEFLMCMGMREKERRRLIRLEIFRYFYTLPMAIAVVSAGIFTALVFQARQYQMKDIRGYLMIALPLWAACLFVTGMVVSAVVTGYASNVEKKNGNRK